VHRLVGVLRERRAALALSALVALVFGAWLGRVELLNPDEARHAEIAREMLLSGSYLTPQLGGEPYYDKPAAYYWLLALSFSLLGVNETAARAPSVLASLACLAAIKVFAQRAFSTRTAWLAVAALATTPAFVAIGRSCIIDMSFTAALVGAASLLGIWWVELPRRRRDAPVSAFALIGAGVLLKGPAALAIAAFLLGMLVMAGTRAPDRGVRVTLRYLRPLRGLLVVLVVTAPWYVSAWLRDPAYIATFLLDHNVARYVEVRPGLGHVEAWWYYPVLLPALLLPWTPHAVAGLFALARRTDRSDGDLYCVMWALAVVLFFLPADAKLATYLLPALPPLACIGAAWADRMLERRGPAALRDASFARVVALVACSITTLAAAASCIYLIAEFPHWRGRLWTALPALLSLPTAVMYTRAAAQPDRALAVTAAAACGLLLATYGMAGDVVGEFKGTRSLARLFARLPDDIVIGAFKTQPHGATFYSGRIVRRLEDPASARALLLGDTPALVVMMRRHVALLGGGLADAGVVELWSTRAGLVALARSTEGGGTPSH
jgi:4-amino-4-deoxy-L-arabinose transferase-like glycosyltransferase